MGLGEAAALAREEEDRAPAHTHTRKIERLKRGLGWVGGSGAGKQEAVWAKMLLWKAPQS